MAHTNVLATSDIFDCADISKFTSTIVQMLPYKGMSRARFYACEIDDVPFLTKLEIYVKYVRELYDKLDKRDMHGFDAEIAILTDFKQHIIYANVSPHIVEIIYHKICKIVGGLTPARAVCSTLQSAVAPPVTIEDDLNDMLCRSATLVETGLAYNKMAFVVLEHCDITLDEYLHRNVKSPANTAIVMSFIFAIVYTLFAIQRLYPKFRHYDLHTDNIILLIDHDYVLTHAPKYTVYTVDGIEYAVPYFGIIPKIIDFGNSILPERDIYSSNVKEKRFTYERASIDILFLFHWMYAATTDRNEPSGIHDILSALDPTRSFILYNTSHIADIQSRIPSYTEMLNNPIFGYKNKNIKGAQVHAKYGI